jgi:hypothetical protein
MAGEAQREDENLAAAARDQALGALVSLAVELGVLLALSLAVQHRETIALQLRRARARARRMAGNALPDDAGLRVGEFAAAVSAYDHGARP